MIKNNNIIALIGPKAVGKSLIASKLSENMGDISIFSSDTFDNFIMAILQGGFRNVSEFRNLVISEYSEEKLKRKYPGIDKETLRHNKNYLENYLKSIEIIEKYADLLKSKQIYYQTIKLLETNKPLSLKQMLFILQYQKILILTNIIKKIDQPIILDFGADLGAIISLNDKEKDKLSQIYQKPFHELMSAQKQMFENCGIIAYLSPGKDYIEKSDARISDDHNKIYRESEDSYSQYANIEMTMNGMFYDPSNYIFRSDKEFQPGIATKKNKLMNKGNVDNICDILLENIEELKQMQ